MTMRGAVVVLFASLMMGCCNCGTKWQARELPPPISLEEQVARLNDRSAALPRLWANAAFRGIETHLPKKEGGEDVQNFEGVLQLQQHPARPDQAAHIDVRLVALAMSNEALDAGANATTWWLIPRSEDKIAMVGDPRKPIDWSRFTSETARGHDDPLLLMRADLVPDLLGLTPLPDPAGGFSGGQALVMRVDDPFNDLLVETLPSADEERIWIRREILIDRATGDIQEVRLYDPRGILVVSSQLKDYGPVAYVGKNNDAERPNPPRVPFTVQIEYPAKHARILLRFDKVTVPESFKGAFQPDFEGRGLKIERVD